MYGCENWTIKKSECRRTDALEFWCWRRLLRVPWTARRSNLSILKEISPGYSLEGLTLKLKLQYFGHLMQRSDSFEKTLRAGGEGDDRGWDGWMASPTWRTWVWVNLGVGDGQGGLACWDSWSHKESDMTERLNWTEVPHNYNTEVFADLILLSLTSAESYFLFKSVIFQGLLIYFWLSLVVVAALRLMLSCPTARGISVLPLGIEPASLALQRILNHCITKAGLHHTPRQLNLIPGTFHPMCILYVCFIRSFP